jgi:2-amino-4-hydroxy-6-hydroxymethyldihydropteridine diphosphokinase
MIYIALGANLPSARHGAPRATLEAALNSLSAAGLRISARSRWHISAPVPAADQPDYVNGVVAVEPMVDALLEPASLLARLHAIEREFGRVRGARNEARVLDLDLIAFHDRVSDGADGGPILPHPRLLGRAFVLLPLQEIAPHWRHPGSGRTIAALVAALPPGSGTRPLA